MAATLRRIIPLAIACLLAACAQLPATPEAGMSLRLIGEQRIAWKQAYQGTAIGGLSGIDYDAKTDGWVMTSDDRSAINPARFYTAKLRYDAQHVAPVEMTGVHFYKQADGSSYPNLPAWRAQGGEVPDIESIRLDPHGGSIWYTSEGDRKLGAQPFIRHARADGSLIGTLPLPPMFAMPAPGAVAQGKPSGVRDNLGFEGLSFAADGQSLWVAIEAPLLQDGPVADFVSGAHNRITRFGRDGQVLAQYVYPLEKVASIAGPTRFAENGISEILAIDEHRLLVIERAGVQDAQGVFHEFVRLFEMDVRGATDVKDVAALEGASYTVASKRLVLDMNTLNLPRLDNIEGISWGPTLANGHASLVMVSDDNFHDKIQVTQFLVFEVLPK
ncbi:esterase-like activity of phytase family protein [Janthinobacterium sp. HLX7-2]|uniref:esterase-like activity of phytase family protein n=1 Tax=Janthinobacterium sp. HLX7-2 TaxID=1259331 RepID=UPI003F21341E